jgi:RNA polymerase sigma factor (sigma-70 family)
VTADWAGPPTPGQDPYGDIESLIRALHDELGGVAFRYLGHHDDAKEAVQEGLIKASRCWPKIAGFTTAGRQRAYLVRIVINEALQIRRRAHRKWELLTADGTPPSETGPGWIPELPGGHGYTAKEHLLRVCQAIGELPDGNREVVALFAAGYEYQEISEMLDVAVSTVRSHVHLGRKRLPKPVPDDGEEGLK